MRTIDIIVVFLLVTFWSFHCGVIGYAFGKQAAYEEALQNDEMRTL